MDRPAARHAETDAERRPVSRLHKLLSHLSVEAGGPSPGSCARPGAAAAGGHAAEVGSSVEALDTPALVVDLDALEHNVKLMAEFTKKAGCVRGYACCSAVLSGRCCHRALRPGPPGR